MAYKKTKHIWLFPNFNQQKSSFRAVNFWPSKLVKVQWKEDQNWVF